MPDLDANVGVRRLRAAANVGERGERGRGEYAVPEQRIARKRFAHAPGTAQHVVDRRGDVALESDPGHDVILEVFPDPGEMLDHFDSVLGENRRIAETGQLE